MAVDNFYRHSPSTASFPRCTRDRFPVGELPVMMPQRTFLRGKKMIEAGIFLLLTILFLAIVRGFRTFALIVFWCCFGFILLDFLFHATSPLAISL